MAKKLGPDGVPVNIPSTPLHGAEAEFSKQKSEKASGADSAPSKKDRKKDPKPRSLFPEEPTTRLVNRSKDSYAKAGDSPKTVIAGGQARRDPKQEVDAAKGDTDSGMADPVVGWLVVTDGPGKGSAVRLGNGQNSIGRGETSRVRLNFGDSQISRNDHAVVIYDPKQNRFYIRQGQGVNLVYLDDNPVLSPTPLPSGGRITLGETTLRFVALCNDEFQWLEQKESAD